MWAGAIEMLQQKEVCWTCWPGKGNTTSALAPETEPKINADGSKRSQCPLILRCDFMCRKDAHVSAMHLFV